jgi:hypothetical protein
MLSIQMLRLIADERERDIQRELRIRRLLGGKAGRDNASTDSPAERYPESWRASTPRASATTR